MRRRLLIACCAGALIAGALAPFATAAFALERQALWQVVRACVADYKLTGAPFPCLQVDLSGGEERGNVILGPPLLRGTILAPTRKVIGVEDPFLQSPGAPNYFDAAWRARSFLVGADGKPPERERVALGVNSVHKRSQDQLHIHIGCLVPSARLAVGAAAAQLRFGEWARVGPIIPHSTFWGMKIKEADLAEVQPIDVAAAHLADRVRNREDLTVVVANARIDGENDFLILASYVRAPGSWWSIGAEDLIDARCS
jgi:CDP-diacylglycerol pyrophosphatase